MAAVRYLSSRINDQVTDEDRRLCGRVQRGLASSSYTPGPLSGIERWLLQFHNLLRERIPEVGLASAPAAFGAEPPACGADMPFGAATAATRD
jgi:phenylpropionate dioxygenase-like ring-hydroxylating dioxygenase large terminal subunit